MTWDDRYYSMIAYMADTLLEDRTLKAGPIDQKGGVFFDPETKRMRWEEQRNFDIEVWDRAVNEWSKQ